MASGEPGTMRRGGGGIVVRASGIPLRSRVSICVSVSMIHATEIVGLVCR